jgi:hypothetical protein
LWWVGRLAWNQNEVELARDWARKCLAVARATGDPTVTAVALAFAGALELAPLFKPLRREQPQDPPTQDRRRGEALLAEAVALARCSNDPEVWLRVLAHKFTAHMDTMRNLGRAQTLAGELLEAARRLDTLTCLNVEAYVSAMLAAVAQRQENVPAARSYAQRALRHVREHGFMMWAADCLQVLAWVADQTGEGRHAARLFGASAAEAERHGILGYVGYLEHEAAQASTRAVLGENAWAAAYAAGRALSLEEAIAAALGEID